MEYRTRISLQPQVNRSPEGRGQLGQINTSIFSDVNYEAAGTWLESTTSPLKCGFLGFRKMGNSHWRSTRCTPLDNALPSALSSCILITGTGAFRASTW